VNAANEHDPDAGFEPAFAAPPKACDAHFHVFGPAEKYAYGTDIRYKPPYEPVDRYLKLARRLGFERYVFVQPSAYGFDNSCMLDAMRQLDPAIRRGIVDLDEARTTDKELSDLDALGVRGIRVNVSPIRKPEAGLAASMRPRDLPVEFSVAHMGLFPAKDGPKQSGFQSFLDLVDDGSKRCWVKLTGIYRFSTASDFADVKPMAQGLIERVPDQLIWGSDFPHLSFHDRVGTIQLYNLLAEWAPDPKTRQRILADNPARLFGFG
jgi:2-pyrone-4,6-dicarboxylate lactonase